MLDLINKISSQGARGKGAIIGACIGSLGAQIEELYEAICYNDTNLNPLDYLAWLGFEVFVGYCTGSIIDLIKFKKNNLSSILNSK